jgi:hypothetical protein
MAEVEENDQWIDAFQPPKNVQDTIEKVHQLEIDIEKIKFVLGNR